MTWTDRVSRDAERLIRSMGETITVSPVVGDDRTITAIVDRDGLNKPRPDGRDPASHTTRDIVEIQCLNDPDNAVVGGIETPEPNLQIVLAGDPRPYVWSGRSNLECGVWILEFTRENLEQIGGRNWLP